MSANESPQRNPSLQVEGELEPRTSGIINPVP